MVQKMRAKASLALIIFLTITTALDSRAAAAIHSKPHPIVPLELKGDSLITEPSITGIIIIKSTDILCIDTIVDEQFKYDQYATDAIILPHNANRLDLITYSSINSYIGKRDIGNGRRPIQLKYSLGHLDSKDCESGRNAVYITQNVMRNRTGQGYEISLNITAGKNIVALSIERPRAFKLPIRRRPPPQIMDPIVDGMPYWEPSRDLRSMVEYLILHKMLG